MVSLALPQIFFLLGTGHCLDASSPCFLLALFPHVFDSLAVKLNSLRGNIRVVRYTNDLFRHIMLIHDSRTCIRLASFKAVSKCQK